MTQQDLVRFWQDGAEEAWKTVEALMVSKRYLHALFFCHLTLEKMLKSKYAKKQKNVPPPTHHLVWLAKQSDLDFSDVKMKQLGQIMKFNISGRYEDDKEDLAKQATAIYTHEWVSITERLLSSLRT